MKTAISQNLKRLRKVKELTQHELAELAGVSQSEICKIEANKLSPTLKTIQRLAQALGQKPEVLMSGLDEYEQIHSLDNVRKSKKASLEEAINKERGENTEVEFLSKMLETETTVAREALDGWGRCMRRQRVLMAAEFLLGLAFGITVTLAVRLFL